jgi:hypothetical protein
MAVVTAMLIACPVAIRIVATQRTCVAHSFRLGREITSPTVCSVTFDVLRVLRFDFMFMWKTGVILLT